MQDVEKLLRRIDEKGLFTKTALEGGFLKLDKDNEHRISKAARLSPEEWADKCRQLVRNQLKKTNMRNNSQAHRDAKKKKGKRIRGLSHCKCGQTFDRDIAAALNIRKLFWYQNTNSTYDNCLRSHTSFTC